MAGALTASPSMAGGEAGMTPPRTLVKAVGRGLLSRGGVKAAHSSLEPGTKRMCLSYTGRGGLTTLPKVRPTHLHSYLEHCGSVSTPVVDTRHFDGHRQTRLGIKRISISQFSKAAATGMVSIANSRGYLGIYEVRNTNQLSVTQRGRYT